jgi:hypothetical protein
MGLYSLLQTKDVSHARKLPMKTSRRAGMTLMAVLLTAVFASSVFGVTRLERVLAGETQPTIKTFLVRYAGFCDGLTCEIEEVWAARWNIRSYVEYNDFNGHCRSYAFYVLDEMIFRIAENGSHQDVTDFSEVAREDANRVNWPRDCNQMPGQREERQRDLRIAADRHILNMIRTTNREAAASNAIGRKHPGSVVIPQ